MIVDVFVQTGLNVIVSTQSGPNYVVSNVPIVIGNSATQSWVSGWVSGNYYPLSNPSGFGTGNATINTGTFLNQFYPLNSNPSGYVTSTSAGVAFIDVVGYPQAVGNVYMVGAGSVIISTGVTGTSPLIIISGLPSSGGTGVSINTGNFVTTGQTGQFTSNSQFILSGNQIQSELNQFSGIVVGTTGAFITTSQTGQFQSASQFILSGNQIQSELNQFSGIVFGTTGVFITTSQTGAFASITFVNTTGALVQSELNQFSGIVVGTTGAFITTNQTGQFYAYNNPNSYIPTGNADLRYVQLGSTGGLASVVNLNATGYQLLQFSGIVVNTTGAFDTVNARNSALNGYVSTGQTGQFFAASATGAFYSSTNPLGYITSAQAGGVSSILVTGVNVSGVVIISGIGGTVVSVQGNSVLISGGGGSSGSIPTGSFVTTGQTGQFITSSQTGQFVSIGSTGGLFSVTSGNWLQSEINVISGTTGAFITTSQTGQFLPIGSTGGLFSTTSGIWLQSEIQIISGTTGAFITTSQTGQFVPVGSTGGLFSVASGVWLQSEILIINGTTGSFITVSQTGQFVSVGSTGGLASVINLGLTGAFVQSEIAIISGTTGAFITSSQTGQFFAANQTGAFYSSTNPAGYITSAATGGVSSITVGTNTLSGMLTLSGLGGTVVSNVGSTISISGGNSSTSNLLLNGSTSPYIQLYSSNYSGSYASYLGVTSNAIGILQLGNNNNNYIVGGNTSANGYLTFVINNTNAFPNTPNGTTIMIMGNTQTQITGIVNIQSPQTSGLPIVTYTDANNVLAVQVFS